MEFDSNRLANVEDIMRTMCHDVPVYPDADKNSAEAPELQSRLACATTESVPSPSSSSGYFSISTPSSAATTTLSTTSVPISMPKPKSSLGKRADRITAGQPTAVFPSADAANGQLVSGRKRKANADVDTSTYLTLNPGLDMSAAIALSQRLPATKKRTYASAFEHDDGLKHYPRRYISIEEAYKIPEKPMRDTLIRVYFEQFHPFCPVVNELDFMDIYDVIKTDEQLIKKIDLTLFQAMMFVAIAYISPAELRSTPYKSVHEGQRALFDKVNVLYCTNYTLDHLVLTKVALLLTYWHPFDAQSQVNNYWVDRAFHHARAIKLWEPQHNIDDTSRCRIVWWCCLLRDRLVSIGLRRAYRIQEPKSTWSFIDQSDFGLELMFPRFMDVTTKKATIDAFIWLCKLSDIIRDIAVFHERNRFDRKWSDGLIDKAHIMPELNQVSQFDCELKIWREGYLKVNGTYINLAKPGFSKMPNYTLIINNSVLASLYLPYIHCPAGSLQIVERFQRVALGKIKAASSMVAVEVRKLNSTGTAAEEIGVGIVGWIALPMAVFKVLSDTDGNIFFEENSGRYSDLMLFLSALAERFHAAKVLADMIGEATTDLAQRSINLGIAPKNAQLQINHKPQDTEVADGSNDMEQAELLDCIAKMVDLGLSTNGKT